jgi:hypothetical protein
VSSDAVALNAPVARSRPNRSTGNLGTTVEGTASTRSTGIIRRPDAPPSPDDQETAP